MVKIEHKRARFVFRLGDLKLEWTIEPRYWRNHLIAIALLLLLILGLNGRPDLLTLITTANIYACIAIPLGWQITGTGRMNFGPQFFVGIGGFTAALASIYWGWNPWQSLLLTILVSLFFALLLGRLTVIAKGLYFSLITLLLPLIFLEFTNIFNRVFRGETGLSGIAHIIDVGDIGRNYLLGCLMSLGLMLVFLYVVDKVLRSRWGVYAAAINDNENVATMLGLNINRYKIVTFTMTSVMIGIAGWFAAHYFGTFAGVTYLPLQFMLKVLLVVMIGGRGEIYGCVVGAYFVALLEHFLTRVGPIHYILFPFILLLLLLALPEGLYGLYRRHRYKEYYPTLKVRKREI
jgi:branched-chain amino acid transport system permease protein